MKKWSPIQKSKFELDLQRILYRSLILAKVLFSSKWRTRLRMGQIWNWVRILENWNSSSLWMLKHQASKVYKKITKRKSKKVRKKFRKKRGKKKQKKNDHVSKVIVHRLLKKIFPILVVFCMSYTLNFVYSLFMN